MALHNSSEITQPRNQSLNPFAHIRFATEDNSSCSSSTSYMSSLDDDTLIHSPTDPSSDQWLSSVSLASNSSCDVDLPFDLFTPFKPQYPPSEHVPTRLLDTLLTKCDNDEFQKLWPLRCSRHESWCRQSLAEHLEQLKISDYESSQRPWSVEWGPRSIPTSNPTSPGSTFEGVSQAPQQLIYRTPLVHKVTDKASSAGINAGMSQPWYRDFLLGCKPADDRSLNERAVAIASKGAWHLKWTMQLLADQFCSQYCDQYKEPWISDGAKFIIPFMVTIRACFEKKLEPHVANSFPSCVQQSTMTAFKLMWNSDQSYCVTSPDSTSSDVKKALVLSRYVGALYQSSLLGDCDIQAAIFSLLHDLKMIEQIQALYYLIVEGGDRLWETAESRKAMETWSKTLERKFVDPATVIICAEGRSRAVPFEVNRWVKHVVDKIRKRTKKYHRTCIMEGCRK